MQDTAVVKDVIPRGAFWPQAEAMLCRNPSLEACSRSRFRRGCCGQ